MIMNDDVIQDLKQFITATVTQATSHLATQDSVKMQLKDLETNLEKKFDDRIDALDEKLDAVLEATGEQLADHEQRITKLESSAA